MKRIKLFEAFVSERSIDLQDPNKAGEVFAGVLAGNKNSKEEPKGSNTGTVVNQYLSSVGLKPGLPWCAAFVYYIFDQVTKRLGTQNPLPKTGGVMNLWDKSDDNLKIDIREAKANPSLIKPGQIFIMSRPGKGLGHTGIVISVDPAKREFVSIEGNTNDQQSGEGDRVGVNRRKIDTIPLIGFIDYFKGERNSEFEKDLASAVDKSRLPLSPLSRGEATPSDNVVSGYSDSDQEKPTSAMAHVISGLLKATGGKLATADEIQAQMNSLR
jgi:hypothetical protein